MVLMLMVGIAVAVAAAARSTWSPCGLSMLSSITPIAERARGHRYGCTASWFVVGATIGGGVLGCIGAAFSPLVGTPGTAALAVGAAGAFLAVAGDAGVVGPKLPVLRRQVNERWLDGYRGWFYGVGFGFQIGVGLATYVMTWSVLLVVALGALTGSAPMALALGLCFGAARGLAVLLSARLRSPEALRVFHRRFDDLGPTVRMVTIMVAGGAALVLAGAAWLPGAAVVALALGLVAWRAVSAPASVRAQPSAVPVPLVPHP